MTPLLKTNQSVRRYLTDRIDLLQQTIEHLGARLREGVAASIGQAVADAAQVAVRAILDATQPPGAAPDAARYSPYSPYPPEDAGYYDGWEPPPYEPDVAAAAQVPAPAQPARPSRWKLALTAGLQVLAYWLRQPAGGRTFVTALGVAAVTGAAALIGGPAGATGAAVIGTVLSLMAMADGTRAWTARLFRATAAN